MWTWLDQALYKSKHHYIYWGLIAHKVAEVFNPSYAF